jgi:DNA-binding LacI/PurR family transcriptional regulator
MKRAATIKDVAGAAGVSPAAVSAALSGKEGASIRLSPETRELILAKARELDYMPDPRARSLRERRSGIVTVITYEKVFPVDWRNEFYGFFVGIEEEAARLGYDILILNNRPDSRPETTGRIDQLGIADGAVVIGLSRDEPSLHRFILRGFPLVFVGRREIAGGEPAYVTFDYESPIREMARRARLAGFAGLRYLRRGGNEPSRDKLRFLEAACAEMGLALESVPVAEGADWPAEARAALASDSLLVFDCMRSADAARAACERPGLAIGSGGPDAAVLEDRWSDSDRFWIRLDSDRVGLGRLAISALVGMIARGGPPGPGEPRLVPVGLLPGDSAPRL